MKSKLAGAVLFASACGFVLAGCAGNSGPPIHDQELVHVSRSNKAYADAETLGRDSDLVVRGQIQALVGTAVDHGGLDREQSGGMPIAFYSVKVLDLRGSAVPVTSLTVALLDLSRVQTKEVPALQLGKEYVLFLERRTAETAPDLRDRAPFYVPTSAGAGVFEVGADGRAVAFEKELEKVRSDGPRAQRVHDRLAALPRDLLAVK